MPVDILADRPINPDEGIPKPQIDVTAQPVDTYVKPVSASASALGQLAGSLKSLNPALGQIEEKFKQSAVEQGERQGQEAFEKERGNWEAAVKNGDIPSVLNPFARMRAREVFGRLAGDKMANDISADPGYIQENQNATTIQQHDTAWANARERWEAKNLGHDSHSDPLFRNAFQAMASAHTQDARNRAVPEIEKNFVTGNGEHLHDELMAHMIQGELDGTDSGQIQSELQQMAEASGLPETVVRASLASAIDDYAHKTGDSKAYDLATGLKIKGYDGKTYNFETDRDFAKLRSAGTAYILREDYQQVRLDNADRIRVHEKIENDVVTDIEQQLATDPNAKVDLKKYEAEYANAGMGSRIGDLPRLLKAIQSKGGLADGELVASYSNRIHDASVHPGNLNYITTGTLTRALANGQLSMPNYKYLQGLIDKRDRKFTGRTAGNPDANQNVFNRGLSQVKTLFSPQRLTTVKILRGDPYHASVLAEQAYNEAYDSFIDSKGGDVTPHELEQFLSQTVEAIDAYYFTEPEGLGQTQLNPTNTKKKPVIKAGAE